MDEDFDELGPIGPRPGQSMRKVFNDEDPPALPREPDARRSSSSGPPPTLFHSMPDRWSQHENDDVSIGSSRSRQSNGRKSIMSFDEEEEDEPPPPVSTPDNHIRQEALRMLEVADSGPYSVHKTVTGGFMAEPRSMGSSRRVPTALAGLGSFAKPNRPKMTPTPPVYRDDPPMEEDYDDYDDSRFAPQQAQEEVKKSAWSSRYSVDDTLFAMSGGAVKSTPKTSSTFLDKLDTQNERKSARNMFMASPVKESKIFGAGGFAFRAKNIFGKQGVVASDNLRTVWMDAGASNSPSSPARSWQDNLKEMRKKRRTYLIIAALLCAFLVILVAMLGSRNRSGDMASTTSKTGPNGEEAITFLITSDVPWDADEEKKLEKDLKTISKRADFLVHLGNIQDAEATQCEEDHYEKVASILKESTVPVFVLPGEEDWNNCPNQDEGWYHWLDNFLRFDNYFDKDYEMMRQQNQKENFAFIDRDVLFVAVHETNGRIDDMPEVIQRNRNNVEWVAGVLNMNRQGIRALVILSNGRPLLRENNGFYMGLANVLFQFPDLPTAFVHANDGDGDDSITYKMYDMDGMDHVVAIQSTRGENHEPLRIHVGWDETNPFIVG